MARNKLIDGAIGGGLMLVVIVLFDSIRKPLLIFLAVPLAIIGVTVGLLATGQPFGFMALLGFLGLVGVLIRNSIVLVDEIRVRLAAGREPFDAIVDSGVSCVRPVSMAALTTVLGMIPLLVVPVRYACFFRVPSPTVPHE